MKDKYPATTMPESYDEAMAEYVSRAGVMLEDALPRLISEAKYVLVGENHLSEYELLRSQIANQIPSLKEAGLTHLAVEVCSSLQKDIDEFDVTGPNPVERLKKLFRSKKCFGFSDGNYQMIISAKLNGIKVLAIDSPAVLEDQSTAYYDSPMYHIERDKHMLEIINQYCDKKSRVLVYIGSLHIKQEVQETRGGIAIPRIGTHLRLQEKAGDVISIRSIIPGGQLNGLFTGMGYCAPRVDNPSQVWVVPEKGVFTGDPRIVSSQFSTVLL